VEKAEGFGDRQRALKKLCQDTYREKEGTENIPKRTVKSE